MAGRRGALETDRLVADFDEFYRANYAWAVNVAHLLTGSPWAAEELSQEAFRAVHARFDGLDLPAAYLRVCVANSARSWHRRRHRERSYLAALPEPSSIELGALELLDALERLPYGQKAVLVLRYYADWSCE